MRKLLLFLAFLLILPTALADITILTDQNIYNLGNKIRASASALYEADFDGLFKLTISCDGYRLQYFTTPISLEANSRTAINIPELAATSSMLGSCTLTGELSTNDNLVIEMEDSNTFEVTYRLKVLPVNSKINALPSESIRIVGVVNEAFGNNVLKANVEAMLDNSTHPAEAVDGKFNVLIELPKSINSGKHAIEITASDSKNNRGSGFIELEITPVPSYIKLEVSSYNVEPGTKISITSSLYDQADDVINASLGLELVHENKEKIFTKTVKSNEKIDYEFSQYSKPGNYFLASAYGNLQAQSIINVSTLREVRIKYENQSVFIENIGNVPFIDELTLFVQNELKKYLITKKVSIEPGKSLMVDLSKEVPEGVYNIILPLKESTEPVRQKLNQSLAKDDLLANEVRIEDNRPLYKRLRSSLGSISVSLVGADGLLTKNPLIAPTLLISIILLIVVRYGRRPIANLLKGKKEGKKEDKEN